MKNTKSRERERGFTLIELMVVISIIGLLSSIVLVALKDVRQKAQATKFRAEVDQFIKALELYKGDNDGKYPFEIYVTELTTYSAGFITNQNIETTRNAGSDLLSKLMSKYLKSLPKVPANSFTLTQIAWFYVVNSHSGDILYRCEGDVYIPNYLIFFTNQNPTIYNIYSDLPKGMFSSSPDVWEYNPYKCFSLK